VGGCVVVAVGAGVAGTVAYVKGDLEAVEARDIDAVHAATRRALKDLGLTLGRDTRDALSAVIIARDAQDKKIKVKLKSMTAKTTKISIRVGVFGSKTKSNLIYQKIHDYLK
jgi:hypothetical protein